MFKFNPGRTLGQNSQRSSYLTCRPLPLQVNKLLLPSRQTPTPIDCQSVKDQLLATTASLHRVAVVARGRTIRITQPPVNTSFNLFSSQQSVSSNQSPQAKLNTNKPRSRPAPSKAANNTHPHPAWQAIFIPRAMPAKRPLSPVSRPECLLPSPACPASGG